MSKVWIEDRWLKDALIKQPDGTTLRVSPPASVKRALNAAKNDPMKAKVPQEYRSADYGKGKRWRVSWIEEQNDGKPRRRRESFSSLQDAEKRRTELADDYYSGRYISKDDKERTFEQAAAEWRSSQQPIRTSSARNYDNVLRMYILPRWGNIRLADINSTDIATWVNELKEGTAVHSFKEHARRNPAKPKPKYLNQIVNVCFGGVIRYAFRRGWIQRDPMIGIRVSRNDPEGEERRKVVLGYDEIEELAQAAYKLPVLGRYKRDRYDLTSATIIRFMAYVGTRPNETFALHIEDIDFENRRARINKTIREYDMSEGPTKNGKIRNVPVPSFLIEDLRTLAAGREPDEYLFTNSREGVINLHNWRNRVFTNAVEGAGLGDINGLRPHSLRHTFVTLCIRENIDPSTIARYVGDDLQTVLKEYAGYFPDALDQASSILERARASSLDRAR